MNRSNPIHLNVQTNCNLSFSLITIESLLATALASNLNSLVICDYKPYEFLKFYYRCQEQNIKPVWGLKRSLKINETNHLISFFPRNYLAFKKLNRFLFQLADEIDVPALAKISNFCLIVLEARNTAEVDEFANLLVAVNQQTIHVVSKESFYIGLNFAADELIACLATKQLQNLIPFWAVKFLEEKEQESLRLLKESPLSSNFPHEDCYLATIPYLSKEGIGSNLGIEQALTQTLQPFLKRIDSFLAKVNIVIETATNHETHGAFAQLEQKCSEGLRELTKSPKETKKYQLILQEELAVIKKLSYSNYFTNLSEIVQTFRDAEIEVGPGRGSAVASLVSYLLKLTQIDPVKHNLFFWRFLNEKRKDYPDVDVDIETQGEALELIRQKHGSEFVSKIVVKKKLGWTNAVRNSLETFRVEGVDAAFIEENCHKFATPSNDLKVTILREKYSSLFNFAEAICRLTIGVATHASGLIISDKRLVDFIPLRVDGEFQICLYQNEYLGNLGFRKYDFLSLTESLGFISYLKRKWGAEVPSYRQVDLRDEKTWQLLNDGFLTGLFQVNTPSFAKIIAKFRPQNFADLVLIISINRPGANQNLESIIARRNEPAGASVEFFPIAKISQILRQTFGHIIFEEQVTQIFAYCLAIDFAEAEILRKKLKSSLGQDNQIEQLRTFFIEKSLAELTTEQRHFIWESLAASAAYLFNKAHAVSYAYLTYYTAYLKANFAPDAICYFLNKYRGDNERTSALLLEANTNNYKLVLPEVNDSQLAWIYDESSGRLLVGYSQFTNAHHHFFENLVKERNHNGHFKSWEDFITRMVDYLVEIPTEELAVLIELGFFRSLGGDCEDLLAKLTSLFRYIEIKKAFPFSNNGNLPFPAIIKVEDDTRMQSVSTYDNNKNEKENFNLYISYFTRWKQMATAQQLELTVLTELFRNPDFVPSWATLLKVYVVITTVKRKKTGFWLGLCDRGHHVEIFVNETTYRANYSKLVVHAELLLLVRIAKKDQNYYFTELVGVSEN